MGSLRLLYVGIEFLSVYNVVHTQELEPYV
jgi:hypothetical protein